MGAVNIKDRAYVSAVKMADIGFIAALYFFLGFFVAGLMDRVLGPYDVSAANRKSIFRLMCEAVLHVWVVGIAVYVARNIMRHIPSPFDGMHGFEHGRVRELTSASFFSYVLLFYSYNLQGRLTYLYKRVMKGHGKQ